MLNEVGGVWDGGVGDRGDMGDGGWLLKPTAFPSPFSPSNSSYPNLSPLAGSFLSLFPVQSTISQDADPTTHTLAEGSEGHQKVGRDEGCEGNSEGGVEDGDEGAWG